MRGDFDLFSRSVSSVALDMESPGYSVSGVCRRVSVFRKSVARDIFKGLSPAPYGFQGLKFEY